jgi:hypothetical protein
MKRGRAPYANRSVWNAVVVLSIVLVVGFAAAGYEIHHLNSEINGLRTQAATVNSTVLVIYNELLKLTAQGK